MKTEQSSSSLRAADSARDNGQWDRAARSYEDHLAKHPTDSGIWTQLGNCLKEAGNLIGAERAYLSSLAIDPENSDSHLQYGHLLKIAGRLGEARKSYQRSTQIDGNTHARVEFNALAGPRSKSGDLAADIPQLIFDCSDLVDYLRHNRLPTGIQRVQINIITGLMSKGETRSRIYITFCDDVFWKSIPLLDFIRLTNSAQRTEDIDKATWEGIRNQILSDADTAVFVQHSILANIGTSWWVPDYFLRIRHLSKKFDIKYVPFLHDCIPLVTPEYCSRGLTESFERWFRETIYYASGILVNSEATGRDVVKFALPLRESLPKPAVVQLDGDMRGHVVALDDEVSTRFALQLQKYGISISSGRGNFVLFVSTLEVRKNHLLALRIWNSLMEARPSENVPHLLCVGKPGWHFEETMNYFSSHARLKKKVTFVSGLDDGQLAEAYRTCLFTLYPSHYEGWGLPVTESLVFGRVPIVSRNSSLPEAGGQHALYFDPLAPRQAYELVARLIDDEPYRSNLEREIAQSFSPRSWDDIAEQLVRSVDAIDVSDTQGRRVFEVPIQCGVLYAIADGASLAMESGLRGDRLRDGLDWWPAERWGTWARTTSVQITGRLQDQSDGVRIYVKVKTPPGHETFKVSLSQDGRPALSWDLEPNQTKWLVYKVGAIEVTGNITLSIEIDRLTSLAQHTGGGDTRAVGVGVISVAFARPHFPDERADVLEQIVLES